ncbi:MAG: serine/threonine protein kinase [Lachnospira sp.]|nr:serine/threonine protein kinase [Lachnospira sp.]
MLYGWLKEVIETEYNIEKVLSRKLDYSIVLAKNKSSGKYVVVREYLGNCDVYKILKGIEHDNLPLVYEAVTDGEYSFVIEEYIEGITIGEVLETGTYTTEGVEKVVKNLVNALKILHKNNIVHRDIKPENIMINKDGDVKLIDFNISRIFNEMYDRDTTILGTNGFAAPEQYGIAETDPRTDIYAVGILINVMLTGEHPAKKLCTGKWKNVVNRCTRINPDDRYQNIEDILD